MFIIGLMLKIRLGADYHLSMIDSFQDFVILLALVPIHEMLHVIVFPDKISSRDIFIGTYRGAIYATYLWDIKKERFLLGFNIADHCFNGYTRSFFNDLKYKLPTFIKNCDYEYGFIESGCPVILWDFDQNSGECKNSK